ELRGCRHMEAARSVGVEPLGMILANSGEGTAKLHGYQNVDPSHEATPAAQVDAIEAATNEANAADFACLTDDERAELVALVDAAGGFAAER
ncbi:MAG: hypothetical protein P8Q20_05730, partial [Acidimicrobiales bacterium]|nr:hypothetical protein [Acidimicrobiales bacterium]